MVQFFKGDVGGELEEKGVPIQASADAEAFFQLPPDIIGTVAGEAGPNLAGRLVGGEKLRAAGAEVPFFTPQITTRSNFRDGSSSP